MMNVLQIDGHKAVLAFDPEIGMFMRALLDLCRETGIEPIRSFSGRFNVRLDPKVHEAAVVAASAQNKSLNEWVAEAIETTAEVG